MLTAIMINDDVSQDASIRGALAEAGCVDIHLAGAELEGVPDLVVLDLADRGVASIARVASTYPDAPILAICGETELDAAFAAGAVECATRPIRPHELLARIRSALRVRSESRNRVMRERKKSARLVALQREMQDLERLVCVDPLTGIANRRHTFALLEAEWRRSARDCSPLGVVMVDLDCYHAYNERYGHLGGDRCLQRVTEAMATSLRRPSDFLGRYGGEEFVAVLPSTDAAGAKIVAERLRAAVETLAIAHEASVCAPVVTITAGFAAFRSLADLTVDRLIAAADAALLRAKASGRNRIEGDAPLVRPTRVSAQAWQRFAPVFADPWYADRIPPFLAEVHEESRAAVDAIRDGDLDRVRAIARAVEADAIKLGLFVIGRLAGALAHPAQAHEAAEELLQYVTHVQVIYRRPLETPSVAIAE